MTRPLRRPAATRFSVAAGLLAAAIVVGACTSPAASPSMAPESMAPHDSMAPQSMAPESMAPGSPTGDASGARDALAAHPWATATLTDASTGQAFTIADFAGRTVFVEAMAIWCSNCRAQQGRFTEALAQLDPTAVAYVVLTVDPAETADDLARYKSARGFTGTYAVAGRDVSAALKAEFGATALNPPSVPLVRISPDGRVSFSTGGESVDAIIAAVGA